MATELGQAYVQIMPSAKGIGKSTNDILNNELSGVGDSAGDGIGKNLIKGIKNIIVAAGLGKILKDSIMEGANLEQSLGGVEAIFGDAADKVKANAKAAFQTAGVSANEYMEGVTSFAASLLNSTGGNAQLAADVADKAFRDMSDNANRFGTDMASIQNAYQGFAKQNYTMLDNLKLGYGGTKQEMERLLQDAQEISGVEYNIDNLADVYTAIGVIQDKLNVTGTTAKEAATTFSGSFNMMKAAAHNLMGSLAMGEEIGPALQNLTASVGTFGRNAVRLLWNVIQNIPSLLRGALQNLTTAFSNFKFGGLIIAFHQTMTELLNVILTSGPAFLSSAVTMLTGLIPGLINSVSNVISTTAQTIATQIPTMMADLLPKILEFTQRLHDSAGNFVDAGIELLQGLISGIVASIPELLANIPLIIINIAGLINDNVPKLIKGGITMIVSLAKGLWDNRHEIIKNLGNILLALVSAIGAVNWIGLGKNIITFIGNGVKNLASSLPTTLKDIASSAVDYVKNINWLQLGKDIITGIVNGISSVGSLIKDMLMGLASSALGAVKSFLDIGSPSKVFAKEVGQWIPAGIASGIEKNADSVTGAMDDIVDMTTGSMTGSMMLDSAINGMSSGAGYNISNEDSIVLAIVKALSELNLVSTVNIDGKEVARATAPFMQNELSQISTRTNRKLGLI